MDNLSPEHRRKNMQNIRSKNTSIERTIFYLLDKRKVKFEKHYSTYGKPDVAFPKRRVAVFLDSDFWHGWHFLKWKNKLPKDYWRDKISGNIKRDRSNFLKLRRRGWKVLRLWEHQIKRSPDLCVDKIIQKVKMAK